MAISIGVCLAKNLYLYCAGRTGVRPLHDCRNHLELIFNLPVLLHQSQLIFNPPVGFGDFLRLA